MRTYGKIESTFWQNPKVKRLSEPAKILLLYIYSCPHGNSVGCFVLPAGYIMADLEWPPERVTEHVRELVSKGFIERDPDSDLIRIRGWFGHNTIENDNVAKAAIKTVQGLPRCQTLFNLINAINELGNKFINKYRNALPNALPNEFLNPEPNLTEPEPEPQPTRAGAREAAAARRAEVSEQIQAILGHNPNLLNTGRVDTWLRQSYDPELDIYPAIRAVTARERQKSGDPQWIPRSGLIYFDGAIADAHAARTKPMPSPSPVPSGRGNGAAAPPKANRIVVGTPEDERFKRERLGMDLQAYEARGGRTPAGRNEPALPPADGPEAADGN